MMPDSALPYKISFSTGGLLYREAIKAAGLYRDLGDWQAVRQAIRSQNLLQARTQATLARTTQELIQRLQVLTAEQLDLLLDGSQTDQQLILWLAACKQYRFVREFAVEVLREKFLRFDLTLDYADFDYFFSRKAEWSDELNSLTDTTRKKLRQVLFRMLREAGLLSTQDAILPIMLFPNTAAAIAHDSPVYFTCFPLSDGDISALTREHLEKHA